MADENTAELKKKCAGCGKAIKRVRRYYRNGLYYCNNNCFKAKIKKDSEKKESEK